MTDYGNDLAQQVQENVSIFAKKHEDLLSKSQVDITRTGPELTEAVVTFLASKIDNEPLLVQCKPFLTSFQQCHESVSETGRNPATGLDHCNRELAKLLSNSSYSIQEAGDLEH